MIKSQATLGLIDHVSTLTDPRQAWRVIYPLPEIMLTVLAATLTCADDVVEIEEWGNANRLHWVLDVVFHDDLSRLRSGNGPLNMAIVKYMAINLLRAATPLPASRCGEKRQAGTWVISKTCSAERREMFSIGSPVRCPRCAQGGSIGP